MVAPTIPVPRTPIFILFSPFASSTGVRFESARDLHSIGDLLKARDHAVAHCPDVRETRLEGFAGGFRLGRICADGDDVVACFKKFGRLGAPILKIGEQAREEIRHSLQSEINIAVRKTLDDFPSHVRRENLTDDFRITARLVKSADDGDVVICVLCVHFWRTQESTRKMRGSFMVNNFLSLKRCGQIIATFSPARTESLPRRSSS